MFLPPYTFSSLALTLMGVWARGAPKKWNPLLISTTAEDNDFKFGKQLGLREYHKETTFTTKNGVGVG